MNTKAEEPTTEERTTEELTIDKKVEAHPIARSMVKVLRRLHDVRWSAEALIPLAAKALVSSHEKAKEKLVAAEQLLDEEDPSKEALAVKNYLRAIDSIDQIQASELIHILETGLFMAAFSSFDAFTGDLLSALYDSKPELYHQINRSISIRELLEYEDLEDVKSIVLANEIDSFRRESYAEQFKALESRFGVKLREFDKWPDFVEATQRRNLLTHCDGQVTKQYVSICESEGYDFGDETPTTGVSLGVGPDYFFESTAIIMGTSLMLGQTLWRKLFPDEMELADYHLNETVFGFLETEEWTLASDFAEYAFKLRKRSEPVYKRLAAVNFCIALKNLEDQDRLKKVLGSMDWSDTALDFKLAKAILEDDLDKAASVMIKIGTEGEYVSESSYHRWPLFRGFVDSIQFRDAYEDIYGHPFITELKKIAAETEEQAGEHVKEEVADMEKQDDDSNSDENRGVQAA